MHLDLGERRFDLTGALYAWELERGRRNWRVPVRGGIVSNDPELNIIIARSASVRRLGQRADCSVEAGSSTQQMNCYLTGRRGS
jgi:hypothetical protein